MLVSYKRRNSLVTSSCFYCQSFEKYIFCYFTEFPLLGLGHEVFMCRGS
jgi:hypothetical protein